MATKTTMYPSRSTTLSLSGSNASAAINPAGSIRLVATTDCFVKFGGTAATTDMFLPGGYPEYFESNAATTVQAITSGATGTLYITEMN